MSRLCKRCNRRSREEKTWYVYFHRHYILAKEVHKTDPVEEYEAKLHDMRNEYKAKTTRQKYAKSEKYSNFRQGIFVRYFGESR